MLRLYPVKNLHSLWVLLYRNHRRFQQKESAVILLLMVPCGGNPTPIAGIICNGVWEIYLEILCGGRDCDAVVEGGDGQLRAVLQ